MTIAAFAEIECPTERAVLQALLYFEVFSYPLTAEEVFHYCEAAGIRMEEVIEKLQLLVTQDSIFQYGIYFQTKKDLSWVETRVESNARAAQYLSIARRRARLIGRFPFVRGVFVSGSLSKYCMGPDSDIDFFVVTEPGRLWLARTLLILFKKIFLFNSHKYFCVNYFIDTDHLTIAEKNRFTATETVTLLPMYGREYFAAFCQANGWAWEQYPNFPRRSTVGVPEHTKGFFKTMLEKLLLGKMGAWLDKKAMTITVGYWKRKFKYFDDGNFDIALKSRRYVSKHHPLHFQEKVLGRFEGLVKERGVV